MDLNLKDKVVVITGGATGIGKSTAGEFLKEGCKVAICARRQENLSQAYEDFKALGFEIMTKSVDVCDYSALEIFAQDVVDRYGKIDIWINNAGANKIQPLVDYTVEEFKSIIDVNLVSVFSGCKIAQKHMKGRGGVILNAASFAALIPNAGRAPYSAAKAGVLSLTRTFAAELSADNIRVVSYVPGLIQTEITVNTIEKYHDKLVRDIPMRRLGLPEDLSRVLVFAASDAAKYINGTHIEISGGKFCVQNPQYAYEG
jgi:Dehydrogenases with different specificities (related to short-chain alcohol dehydrogenases)